MPVVAATDCEGPRVALPIGKAAYRDNNGCAAAGTSQIVFPGGRVAGQGFSGAVNPSGAMRSVGNVNGLGVRGNGRIVGRTATGSYRPSDGCSSPWSAVKL